MRVLLQRVKEAGVTVAGETISTIGAGLLVFLGICKGDTRKEVEYLAEKTVHLRIFNDTEGKLNCSALQVGAELLAVSQFTLYGDCRKGRRPSYSRAMPPEEAKALYDFFITCLEAYGLTVRSGIFQETMEVNLINDGPVTILIDS